MFYVDVQFGIGLNTLVAQDNQGAFQFSVWYSNPRSSCDLKISHLIRLTVNLYCFSFWAKGRKSSSNPRTTSLSMNACRIMLYIHYLIIPCIVSCHLYLTVTCLSLSYHNLPIFILPCLPWTTINSLVLKQLWCHCQLVLSAFKSPSGVS